MSEIVSKPKYTGVRLHETKNKCGNCRPEALTDLATRGSALGTSWPTWGWGGRLRLEWARAPACRAAQGEVLATQAEGEPRNHKVHAAWPSTPQPWAVMPRVGSERDTGAQSQS